MYWRLADKPSPCTYIWDGKAKDQILPWYPRLHFICLEDSYSGCSSKSNQFEELSAEQSGRKGFNLARSCIFQLFLLKWRNSTATNYIIQFDIGCWANWDCQAVLWNKLSIFLFLPEISPRTGVCSVTLQRWCWLDFHSPDFWRQQNLGFWISSLMPPTFCRQVMW